MTDVIYRVAVAGVLAVVFVALFFLGGNEEKRGADEAEPEPAEPVTAGGFPVPPMPAGGPVRGAAAPLTFRTSTLTGEES